MNDLIITREQASMCKSYFETKDYEKIMEEVMDEPCMLCGKKTGQLKEKKLNLMETTDDKGDPLTLMVCSKCLKSKKNKKVRA